MKKKLLSVLLTLAMMASAFGSFSVVASAGSAVAQVIDSNGNVTDYSTFEAAWKEAVNYGKTFKLLSNWMVSGSDFSANELIDEITYYLYVYKDGKITVLGTEKNLDNVKYDAE